MAGDRKTVYVETTVVSYLTARPTADLVDAARRKVTVDWWETRRERFDLYASQVVVEEVSGEDREALMRRLAALAHVAVLTVTEAAEALARELVRRSAVPAPAHNDALHVAVSAVHGVDYLLTWNHRHLNNAETKPIVRDVCAGFGRVSPEICTPGQLMGGTGMADEIIEEMWRIKGGMARGARVRSWPRTFVDVSGKGGDRWWTWLP